MAAEDSWVFDSLVCFLHGPVWNAPLQTFIEQKSLVFDPNLQLDENNEDIRQIHEEYKNLVDFMLGSFMEEMHITPEQFELACLEGRQQGPGENPFQFHQVLFQQIWAANDLKIFIRMMTQRNVELQLQALDLIEKHQLARISSAELAEDEKSATGSAQGDAVAEVEQLIAKTVADELESPEAALTPEQDGSLELVNDKFQRLNLFFEQEDKVDPNDVVSRQEYLRQQRDKIVEIKKQTRAKQLQDTVARSTPGARPSSAQVAQQLLETPELALPPASVDEAENTALQLRRTLAKRLRNEVVEHN
ncbi:cilia- and flagella-associated protein 36 isoform X2 [Drosophila grimshawi]|uniref:Cilia- and flagella-associated protein 36 n=1 Tax=Drosophila grimshawi TaxID=7222 RepID=B4JYB5_DROGR|nr:cilia- and flagella-associated protein 36 isoform X2 [Drosophila grimshawi]EDV90677.1 GH14265 [Drosophila grimshawi]